MSNIKNEIDFIKSRIHSLNTLHNRKRFYDNRTMTEDMELYFLYFSDNNWNYFLYPNEYYMSIDLIRDVHIKDMNEHLFKEVVENMNDIRNKLLEIENIKSKFIIKINDITQQESIDGEYRECLYKFKGFGEYKDNIIQMKIKYTLI